MKGFVITLQSAKHARKQLDRFMKQADLYNYDVDVYWAVEGLTLTDQDFAKQDLFLNPDTTIYKRKGAQGCFMSHWNLWHHCVDQNQPIVVFESDAYITDVFPDIDINKYLIKLHIDKGTKQSEVTGSWSKGAHAYTITPKQAQCLIDGIRQTEVKPVDKAIGDKIVAWKHLDFDLVPQKKLGRSTTSI